MAFWWLSRITEALIRSDSVGHLSRGGSDWFCHCLRVLTRSLLLYCTLLEVLLPSLNQPKSQVLEYGMQIALLVNPAPPVL